MPPTPANFSVSVGRISSGSASRGSTTLQASPCASPAAITTRIGPSKSDASSGPSCPSSAHRISNSSQTNSPTASPSTAIANPSPPTRARTHFPNLVLPPLPVPKPKRRWERSRIGELWQHDSSIHPWWAAEDKQTLLLTVDDHSRKYLGATFVPTDTTWHHFEHFRRAFLRHGRPVALYTDGLALFGYQSSTDGGDPRSEFQRALTALGVSHLVAPSPQAKGKIERRFGTFQKRLLALLAFERIDDYGRAQNLLDHELEQQNRTVCRTTGLCPDDAWAKAIADRRDAMRPSPNPSLLDLHFALHFSRRLNADHQVDFLGRSWPIGATQRHTVAIIHHPGRQFWVVTTPPKPPENRWSDVLGKFSL
ncbi:MAG: transposase family protein [Verrucomicrobia bacterium]|nr:MAG: transposase family protein [Verrucomicrobiota bacterium]